MSQAAHAESRCHYRNTFYNETLTVQELIDLVAFLQSTYTEAMPNDYDPYFP